MLPHWEQEDATYFITFNTWKRLKLTPKAQEIVLNAFLFFEGERYQLFTLVVMPDHVHCLIQPLHMSSGTCWPLSRIMHSIKSYSAKQIPSAMHHAGTVWQSERYDRIIRSQQEFDNVYKYILQNPVKAGLSKHPSHYPFLWQSSPVGQSS